MIIGIVILFFLITLLLGMPVFFVLGLSSLLYFIMSNSLDFLPILIYRMFSGMDNFVLMAVPLFILTGEIMNRGNITNKLVEFANVLVGRFKGGLAYVNILSSMFFAGITGSALSDVAALGSMLIPAMEKSGYDREFSTAVTAASAIQGPIIPPSIPAVLIAAVTGTSTGALFLGGAIPGMVLGLSCCVVTYFLSNRRQYPTNKIRINFHSFVTLFLSAFFPLLTPLIILGGILGGIFTPTEAAAVAVLYAFVITILSKVKLNKEELMELFKVTILSTAKIYLIIGAASVFAWILAIENIPVLIADFLSSFSSNVYVTLFIINIFLLFWGMWMDTAPSIMILMPLLYPIATRIGIHPTHFGVIVLVNLMIGLLTPPFGMALFSAQAIGKVSLKNLLRELKPFLIADFIVLGLVTFVPEISLYLPRLFGLI
ncbi:MAG: TRAP transporter large permease [Eubacteriales bacterium]